MVVNLQKYHNTYEGIFFVTLHFQNSVSGIFKIFSVDYFATNILLREDCDLNNSIIIEIVIKIFILFNQYFNYYSLRLYDKFF